MGFRDLEAFNTALLCKQIWRVITRPNLLMSKVMKHKYFPKGDIFEATSKAGDSWIWKSWNDSKSLLTEDCNWLVGNGGKVKVWEDKWIKDRCWRKVQSSNPATCTVKTVRDLLHQTGGGWNENLLKQIFREEDVKGIQRTPISLMGGADRLVWHHSKDGQYTARSGYQLAKILQRRNKGDEGSSDKREEAERNMWRNIWNLNIKKKDPTLSLACLPQQNPSGGKHPKKGNYSGLDLQTVWGRAGISGASFFRMCQSYESCHLSSGMV